MQLIKKDKRLMIMDGDVLIYTPPNFLRSRVNRGLMNGLIENIMIDGYIAAVVEFETRLRK